MVEDYRRKFWIPGISFMSFPTYAISKSGKLVNFEAMVYPSPKSAKKYTRRKQLVRRSTQACLFDMLINIGYFNGLGDVIKEMPIVFENSKRLPGMTKGLFALLDYYFPSLKLAIELDSDYHDPIKDKVRDDYLSQAHGIQTFRIKDFQKESVQKGRFHELTALLQSLVPDHNPQPLNFTTDLEQYLKKKGL